MPKPELVDLDLHFHHETDKAILVSADGDAEESGTWLPKSQIEFVKDRTGGVKVTLPEWLAKDKDLV
jgi:hypothetical protein